MFSFTKQSEQTIKLNGCIYHVNLAFNRVIAAFGVLDDESLSDYDKVNECFNLFNTEIETNDIAIKASVVTKLFDYINRHPYGNFNDDEPSQETDDTYDIVADYDFEQDAAAIYASFMAYYHIDLNNQIDKMHWDVFKALFDNLGEKTPISRIRQIRNDDLGNYKDDAKRAGQVAEAQMYYQLDKNQQADSFGKGATSIFDNLMGDAG